MRKKAIAISSVSIFVVAIVWNGFYHAVLIAEQNKLVETLRRPDFFDMMWLSFIITFLLASLFSVSYDRWEKTGELKESLLHGLFFAVLAGVLVNANQYLVYPLPLKLVLFWFSGGLVEFLIYSVIVWFVFKKLKNA